MPPDLVTVAALQGLTIELAVLNGLPLVMLASWVAHAAGAQLCVVADLRDDKAEAGGAVH